MSLELFNSLAQDYHKTIKPIIISRPRGILWPIKISRN